MNIRGWRRWYAWYPVRLSSEVNEGNGYSYADTGNYAWLRIVECRFTGGTGEWIYRRSR